MQGRLSMGSPVVPACQFANSAQVMLTGAMQVRRLAVALHALMLCCTLPMRSACKSTASHGWHHERVLWCAGVISPLLPKSCRFLPTCSEYSMRAYREYGTARGTALTVWRVLRCNPLSEGGFDPPRWPPPGLDWLFGCGPGRVWVLSCTPSCFLLLGPTAFHLGLLR